LKVGVIAADVFRPAAYEQLKQISEKAKIAFYGNPKEKKAEKVVEQGLKEFKGFDLVIVDSAGRDAFDKELVKEIKAVNKVLQPEQTWLVIGADVGQVAKKQATAFHDAVGVNGVIVTRMDGSAKGGGALSACSVAKVPVYFIGVGEKTSDLEEFDAKRFLSRLMGYGDLTGLLEKAKELAIDEEMSPEDILKGEFNLETFYQQLKATRKMGPLNKVAEMLGMKMQIPKEMLETTEEKLDNFRVIMDSMTKEEKLNPDMLNRKRIERIAKGSGTKESEVRELLKQFKQMQKVFKKFRKLDEDKIAKMQQSGKFDLGKMLQGFGPKKKKKFKIR
ncbi:MAG: signal recognition particle protein Srp19, partial [Candidatus Diapherotrites archaeon]|nr:signal recognition particle protein Srp19 [Candidatus Diapherotrites archaeon]